MTNTIQFKRAKYQNMDIVVNGEKVGTIVKDRFGYSAECFLKSERHLVNTMMNTYPCDSQKEAKNAAKYHYGIDVDWEWSVA